MVGVAQLVERQTVALDVAGSNPVTHPMFSIAIDNCKSNVPSGPEKSRFFATLRMTAWDITYVGVNSFICLG